MVIALTLVVSGLNFLYSMLNTRFLGPEDIGIYSLLIQTINTLVLISDFGLSTAFLKFYSLAFVKNKKESEEVLRNSFYMKSIISFSLIILTFTFYPLIKNSFGQGINNKELILLFTTIFTIGISELLMSKYRSEQNFKRFFIYKFLFALFRIIPMAIFYSLGKYNLDVSIGIFAYSTLIIVLFLLLEQKENFKVFKIDIKFMKELLHFSKWIFISNIALAFLTNGTLELYLLKTYSDKKELGYFSGILIFFTVLNVLNTSLTTLFFPKFASIEGNKKLKTELAKAFKMGLGLSLPLLLLIPFMNYFIILTIGKKFIEVVPLAKFLMLGFFIELSSQVYRLILYIKANKKIALINSLQFLGSILFGIIFIVILRLGAFGAVTSIFIIRVSGAIYMWYTVEKLLKKADGNV